MNILLMENSHYLLFTCNKAALLTVTLAFHLLSKSSRVLCPYHSYFSLPGNVVTRNCVYKERVFKCMTNRSSTPTRAPPDVSKHDNLGEPNDMYSKNIYASRPLFLGKRSDLLDQRRQLLYLPFPLRALSTPFSAAYYLVG